MIRKIHLDFHTRAEVSGVGAAFDPAAFAATLADAHVNALATPGKCNFGNTYFAAQVGHTHPHLVAPELFPDTVRACTARGIRVQAYHNLGMDAHVTALHPDWSQRLQDGTAPQWGMPLVCFASPYIERVVVPGVIEMAARCPGLVGFWFDICLYINGAFYSPWFETLAQTRLGAAAADPAARWRLARVLIRDCCQRVEAVVQAHLPGAENYYNTLVVPGAPENLPLQPIHEVEHPLLFVNSELMTGGVRWLRAHHAPTIGLVSRFQGPWMDPGTLRTPDQLRFDVGRVVALGCGVSMGDHRHPDGTLDTEVYRRVGAVYGELVHAEPWLDGAQPCREVVLLTEIERGGIAPGLPPLTLQAARLLEEAGLQFDIASVEDPLPAAPLIIWPGQAPGTPALQTALRAYVQQGGALLAMAAACTGLEDVLGLQPQLPAAAPAATATGAASVTGAGHVQQALAGFFRLLPDSPLGSAWQGFAQVITQPCRPVRAAADAQVLAEWLPAISAEPPFPGRTPQGAALVQRGRVIYSAVALAAEAMHSGAAMPGELLAAACRALLGRPLAQHTGGTTVAAHLHRVRAGYTLHLLHWALSRWGKQVDSAATFPPLGPISVELAIAARVQRVLQVPSGEPLAFQQDGDVCHFVVPGLHVWQIIGLEVAAAGPDASGST